MKDIEIEIIKSVHVLPTEKQAKVLEFVETLKKEVENGTQSKANAEEVVLAERRKARMSLVGIGRSKTGDISERVDEILAEGINKREGWSLP